LEVLDRRQADEPIALGVFGFFCSSKQGLGNKSLKELASTAIAILERA
jgi:hypothetical protein